MKALRIVGWSRYQHADSKRYAGGMPWVKCPTSHTGLGYLEIMDHADGMSHFAAWVLILQVAAKCPPGGVLVTDSGKPILARELALKTRGKSDIFSSAIDRLVSVGWLEWVEITADGLLTASGQQADSKRIASGQQADSKRTACIEKRREEKRREDNTTLGGVVDIDPDKGEDIADVVAPPQPPVAAPKATTSFLDWINAGHPRVHIAGENMALWRGLWDSYEKAWNGEPIENRREIFDEMYTVLVRGLDQPRFKIWPTNAQEWLMAKYPLPKGDQ